MSYIHYINYFIIWVLFSSSLNSHRKCLFCVKNFSFYCVVICTALGLTRLERQRVDTCKEKTVTGWAMSSDGIEPAARKQACLLYATAPDELEGLGKGAVQRCSYQGGACWASYFLHTLSRSIFRTREDFTIPLSLTRQRSCYSMGLRHQSP